MEGHERWWDQIWAAMSRAGVQEVTCTPEHGPPNYQVEISLVAWWGVLRFMLGGCFFKGNLLGQGTFLEGKVLEGMFPPLKVLWEMFSARESS